MKQGMNFGEKMFTSILFGTIIVLSMLFSIYELEQWKEALIETGQEASVSSAVESAETDESE